MSEGEMNTYERNDKANTDIKVQSSNLNIC